MWVSVGRGASEKYLFSEYLASALCVIMKGAVPYFLVIGSGPTARFAGIILNRTGPPHRKTPANRSQHRRIRHDVHEQACAISRVRLEPESACSSGMDTRHVAHFTATEVLDDAVVRDGLADHRVVQS
jgi:hypothetical protein